MLRGGTLGELGQTVVFSALIGEHLAVVLIRWVVAGRLRSGLVGATGDWMRFDEHGQAVLLGAFNGEQLAVVLVSGVLPNALSCLEVEVENLALALNFARSPRKWQRRHESSSGTPNEIGVSVQVDSQPFRICEHGGLIDLLAIDVLLKHMEFKRRCPRRFQHLWLRVAWIGVAVQPDVHHSCAAWTAGTRRSQVQGPRTTQS
mmetsp:Transcript_39829/g.126050  ORF Transcript_39829/g.126050 Transcript_39829/m.126050 type:complete len:203 (-) Transcript_39829:8-616(-)